MALSHVVKCYLLFIFFSQPFKNVNYLRWYEARWQARYGLQASLLSPALSAHPQASYSAGGYLNIKQEGRSITQAFSSVDKRREM